MATTTDDLQSSSTYEPYIKSIDDLQLENQNLTTAENQQIAQNPALEAPLKKLQAERADRIERQKKYNSLMLSQSAQNAIESMPLAAQKWDVIKIVETDYDYKNPSEDALIYVQEESALTDAKSVGGNYYLTVKFAVQENRAQRQAQINGLKKYYEERDKQQQAALDALLTKTEAAKLERTEKLTRFVNEVILKYVYESDAREFYGFPDRTWIYCGVEGSQLAYLAPWLRGRPYRVFQGSGGKQRVGISVWEVLKASKEIVLRDPHEFLNTIKDNEPAMRSTVLVNTGQVMNLNEPYPHYKAHFVGNKQQIQSRMNVGNADIGPGNSELLITALLDECFPFYADVKSGVKKYPYFIDYGENVPFPNPDQAYQGYKKLLKLGTREYAEGIFRIMKKISEINTTQNVRNNVVIAFPKTTKYHSSRSDFSAPRNPIIAKPNPLYDPAVPWALAYNLSYDEAKILWDEWQGPMEKNMLDRMNGKITKDQQSAANRNLMTAFQTNRAAIYNKYLSSSNAGYHFSALNNPAREFSWIKIYQKGNENFFSDEANFDIHQYFSIRPQSGFFYVPKIGYINPFLATFIPTVSVTSPYALEQDRLAAERRRQNMEKNLLMFKNLVSGMATGNFSQVMNIVFPGSKIGDIYAKVDRFTGGLLTSAQMFGQTAIKVAQGGQHISREETLNALMVMAKVGIIVASGGSATAVIGAVSSQLSQGTLGETAFGRAVLQLGAVLAVSGAAGTTLEQAISQQAERELKSVAVKEFAKETKLDKSVIGIVATQALVETAASSAMGRDWEKTLIEAAKKGAMQVAATIVPGGHLLLEAAFKTYDKGWDAMLPKGFNLDAIENPITAISNVDWKDVGKNILNSLKDKQNKQIIALIATGKMKPEDVARGVFVQKLSEDLAKKTAMTEYQRNPNDPGVKAATAMLAEVHLEQRRHAVAEKIGRGEMPSKSEILLLEPAGEVYLNMLKEVIPQEQVGMALSTAFKIGMPDIKNYLGMQGNDLKIEWPFKLPNLNLMDLNINLSSLSINGLSLPEFQSRGLTLPNFGKIPSPDQLTLFDLPKLGVKIDPLELEKIVKITLPKGVELKPRIPNFSGGQVSQDYHIINANLDVSIRDRLSFSPYEHPMLKYGYVGRKLTKEQELYNMMRTVEVKEAMLKVQEGELALAQMQSNTMMA